jgi:hypothetical protein
VAGNGVLQELTRRYIKVITEYGLEQWAPKDFDFSEFKKGLDSIQAMPLCPGCQKGGGRDDCELRNCVTAKGINDCGECQHTDTCPHKELLDKMQTGALEAKLKVKTDATNPEELFTVWSEELRQQWLTGCLFHDD